VLADSILAKAAGAEADGEVVDSVNWYGDVGLLLAPWLELSTWTRGASPHVDD
jgi:hypothetical protein